MSDPVDDFRQAVQAAFGAPWSTEPTPDGFVARLPLAQASADGSVSSDEVHLRVVADPATRTYSFDSRRIAARDVERERAGWTATGYSASREQEAMRYTGVRRTFTFRRTPEGLVPDPDAAGDSTGREADLRAAAAGLGWTERAGSGGLLAGVTPRRALLVVGIIFGVVVLAIVGVGILVISTALGMLRG